MLSLAIVLAFCHAVLPVLRPVAVDVVPLIIDVLLVVAKNYKWKIEKNLISKYVLQTFLFMIYSGKYLYNKF